MKIENNISPNEILVINFEDENILQYLPYELIDKIKQNIIDDDILDELPSEIALQLNLNNNTTIEYTQALYFSLYDDDNKYHPSISYILTIDGYYEVIDADIYLDIKDILIKLLFVYPSLDFYDSNNYYYLPTILYDFKGNKLNQYTKIIQSRYKYWQSKQWFL
jgi:hypothetical protein